MEDKPEKRSKNVGGRPNLAGDEVLTHRLVTRVNAADNQAIERDFMTWKSGRTGRIADYLREVILNRHSPMQTELRSNERAQMVEMTQTLHAIRQQLKHIDSNFNQVTKRINSIDHSAKLYYEFRSSREIIEQLAPLIAKVDQIVVAHTEAFFTK